MIKSKILFRVITFLLFSVIISAEFSLYRSQEMFAESADLQYSDAMNSLASHQPVKALTKLYDNSPCPNEIRGVKTKTGWKSILLKSQDDSFSLHNSVSINRFVYISAFGTERISVLALSYGSNSPPVYNI